MSFILDKIKETIANTGTAKTMRNVSSGFGDIFNAVKPSIDTTKDFIKQGLPTQEETRKPIMRPETKNIASSSLETKSDFVEPPTVNKVNFFDRLGTLKQTGKQIYGPYKHLVDKAVSETKDYAQSFNPQSLVAKSIFQNIGRAKSVADSDNKLISDNTLGDTAKLSDIFSKKLPDAYTPIKKTTEAIDYFADEVYEAVQPLTEIKTSDLPDIGKTAFATGERFITKDIPRMGATLGRAWNDVAFENAKRINEFMGVSTIEEEKTVYEKRNKKMQDFIRKNGEEADKITQEAISNAKNPRLAKTIAGITQGGLSIAEVIAITAITKNPNIAIGFLATQEATDEYNTAIEKGTNPLTALATSGTIGTINFALEKIGMENLFKNFGKGNLTAFVKSVVGEGLQEGTQTGTTNLISRIGYDKDRKILEGIGEAFAFGALTGGIFSGVGNLQKTFTEASQKLQNKGIDEETANEFLTKVQEKLKEKVNNFGETLRTAKENIKSQKGFVELDLIKKPIKKNKYEFEDVYGKTPLAKADKGKKIIRKKEDIEKERFKPLSLRKKQKTGVGQILERVNMNNRIIFGQIKNFKAKGEKIEEVIKADDIKKIEKFIDTIGNDMFEDVRLSLKREVGNSAGNFNFGDTIITLSKNSIKNGVPPSETMIHEMWHSLSRFIPDEKIRLFKNEMSKDIALYSKDNKWFDYINKNSKRGGNGDFFLNKEQKEEFDKKFPNEKYKVIKSNDDLGEYKLTFDDSTYRYKNIDEFFAEELKDITNKNNYGYEAKTYMAKIKDLFYRIIEKFKSYFGKESSEGIQARTYEDFVNKKYKEKIKYRNLENRTVYKEDLTGGKDNGKLDKTKTKKKEEVKPKAKKEIKEAKAEGKKMNFTEYAKENNFVDDYSVLEHSAISPDGRISKRAKSYEMNEMLERMESNRSGHKKFIEDIRSGKIVDSSGKITRESILSNEFKSKQKKIDNKISQAENYINLVKSMGKVAYKKTGGLRKGYQLGVDDALKKIAIAKEELYTLKKELPKTLKPKETKKESKKETEKAKKTLTTKVETVAKGKVNLDVVQKEIDNAIKNAKNTLKNKNLPNDVVKKAVKDIYLPRDISILKKYKDIVDIRKYKDDLDFYDTILKNSGITGDLTKNKKVLKIFEKKYPNYSDIKIKYKPEEIFPKSWNREGVAFPEKFVIMGKRKEQKTTLDMGGYSDNVEVVKKKASNRYSNLGKYNEDDIKESIAKTFFDKKSLKNKSILQIKEITDKLHESGLINKKKPTLEYRKSKEVQTHKEVKKGLPTLKPKEKLEKEMSIEEAKATIDIPFLDEADKKEAREVLLKVKKKKLPITQEADKGYIKKDEAIYQVLEEIDKAEKGERIFIQKKDSYDLDAMGKKSSFPKWIPETLRSRDLFNKVREHINNGTKPKGNATKQLEVYNLIFDEIEKRSGKKSLRADLKKEILSKKEIEETKARFKKTLPVSQIPRLKSKYDKKPLPKAEIKKKKSKEKKLLDVKTDKPKFLKKKQTGLEATRSFVQDYNLALKSLNKDIREQLDVDVSYNQDIYAQKDVITRKVGDVSRRTAKLKETFVKRLVNDNVSLDLLNKYRRALHAPERNAEMQRRDEKIKNGSGMSNEEAKEILDNISDADKKKLDFYHNELKKLDKSMVDFQVKSGTLDEKTAEAYKNQYDEFVHLFRDVSDIEDYTGIGTGQGIDIKGKADKKAKGSDRDVINTISNTFAYAEKVRIIAEKNKLGQNIIKLVKEVPELKSLFEVKKQQFRPIYDKNGDLKFLEPKFEFKKNVIGARVDGKQYFITVNDKAVLNSLKSSKLVQLNSVFNLLRAGVGLYSMSKTVLNPEFLITNPQRDLGEALINIEVEKKQLEKQGKSLKRDIVKGLPRSAKQIWDYTMKNKGDEQIDEFFKLGGDVGHYWATDYDKAQKKLENLEKQFKNEGIEKVKNIGRVGVDIVEGLNTSVELATRYSTYKELLKRGMKKERAIQSVADLTVNFARQGEIAPFLKSFYAFINPSIQGADKAIRTISNKKARKQVMTALGGLTAFGFIMGVISMTLDPEGDDEISEYDKNHKIVFPDGHGGQIVLWNLPYGYASFTSLGRNLAEYIYKKKTAGEVVKQVWNTTKQGFLPFESSANLVPTLIKPVVEKELNISWADGKIFPDQQWTMTPKPNFTQSWKNTTETAKKLAIFLNDISGGDSENEKAGSLDISPSAIDYLTQQYFGGGGTFLLNTAGTVQRAAKKEFIPSKTPIVRKFYRETNKKASIYEDVFNILERSAKKDISEIEEKRFYNSLRKGVENKIFTKYKANEFKQKFIKAKNKIKGSPNSKSGYEGMKSMSNKERNALLETYEEGTRAGYLKWKKADETRDKPMSPSAFKADYESTFNKTPAYTSYTSYRKNILALNFNEEISDEDKEKVEKNLATIKKKDSSEIVSGLVIYNNFIKDLVAKGKYTEKQGKAMRAYLDSLVWIEGRKVY